MYSATDAHFGPESVMLARRQQVAGPEPTAAVRGLGSDRRKAMRVAASRSPDISSWNTPAPKRAALQPILVPPFRGPGELGEQGHSNAAMPSRFSGSPAARNHNTFPAMEAVASSVSTKARNRSRWARVSGCAGSYPAANALNRIGPHS